jgi:hypothetical protein
MTQMKRLAAVHSLPFFTPAGRLVCRNGHDTDTGKNGGTNIWLHLPFDYSPNIPDHPTPGQVRAALGQLVSPWRGYSWATPDDAAAMVCSVLTAVCRPVLELCPAVCLDGSVQGAGKTKAATALGSLMTGRREGVTPFSGFDDQELRKRIMAGVVAGQAFHCLDNLIGVVKSPALAAVLTSGRLVDRLLGSSKLIDASIQALFTMTANNASLSSDVQRRTMVARIDSGSSPTLRRFAFDPVNEALRDRLKIAEAACTIWRAYFNAGAPRIAGDDAGGFTAWSNLCRQPVLWLQREGLADQLGWELGDPAASMLADPADGDPEIEAHGDLLRALFKLAEGTGFDSHEVLRWYGAGEHSRSDSEFSVLREVLKELTGHKAVAPSARTVGRVLMNRRDRVVGGLKLMASGGSGGHAKTWRIARVN